MLCLRKRQSVPTFTPPSKRIAVLALARRLRSPYTPSTNLVQIGCAPEVFHFLWNPLPELLHSGLRPAVLRLDATNFLLLDYEQGNVLGYTRHGKVPATWYSLNLCSGKVKEKLSGAKFCIMLNIHFPPKEDT